MNITIQVLLIILLAVGIIAVLRLYFVLGDVRNTLEGVEETRKELNGAVQRLNTLVSEEITPTLQSARATLDNLESTTRTLSQATQVFRAFGGSSASLNGSGGNPIAQFVTQQGTRLALGLITTAGAGVVSGIRGLFARKKLPELPAGDENRNRKKTLPPASSDQIVPVEDGSARQKTRSRS